MKSPDSVIVASFFFHARRNVDLEKSPLGLLRSLLYQILLQSRPLLKRFVSVYQQKALMRKEASGLHQWSYGELRDYLLNEFLTYLETRKVILFVDALDECREEDVRRVVFFFRDLANAALTINANVNICLSSRHYPHITIPRHFEIIVEHGNKDDISRYVQEELLINLTGTALDLTVKQQIVYMSDGVFLWVVLVVRLLLEDMDAGMGNAQQIQTRLRSLPADLEELFKQQCGTLRKEEIPVTIKLVQFVLYLRSPATPIELLNAVAFSFDPPATSMAELANSEYFISDLEQFEKFVRNYSRGLIEFKLGKVQFIHQSVQDFFLSGKGFWLLEDSIGPEVHGSGHNSVLTTCLNFISIKEMDIKEPIASHLLPEFLEYAIENLFYHARRAENDYNTETSLAERIYHGDEQLYRRWCILARYRGILPPTGGLLYHACFEGLHLTVPKLMSLGAQINGGGVSRQYPLIAAIHGRSPEVLVPMLIELGADVRIRDENEDEPLHHAVKSGCLNVARIIATAGADINARNRSKRTPLHHALLAGKNVIEMVNLLLDLGAEIDAADSAKRTPLHYAARRTYDHRTNLEKQILSLLLERGADPLHEDIWDEDLLDVSPAVRGLVSPYTFAQKNEKKLSS